jgi:hypothetical protein
MVSADVDEVCSVGLGARRVVRGTLGWEEDARVEEAGMRWTWV